MITTEDRENIDDILDHFNFDKVHKAMQALDWKWVAEDGFAIPEVYQLRKEARRLMEMVSDNLAKGNDEYYVGTGGFVAKGRRFPGDPKKYLTLYFYIDEQRSLYD